MHGVNLLFVKYMMGIKRSVCMSGMLPIPLISIQVFFVWKIRNKQIDITGLIHVSRR